MDWLTARETPSVPMLNEVRRIGHKGAHAIEHGNTVASFEAARQFEVDLIEFDIVRHPIDGDASAELVLAHDPGDATAREDSSLITMHEGLDLLASPSFSAIGLDVDMKHRGFELELLDALRERELLERTMITTMELESIQLLREHTIPGEVKLGLTIPRVTKDWLNMPSVIKPLIAAGVIEHRWRQPGRVAKLVESGVIDSVMAFHKLITPRLVRSVREAGGELYAWTVDDPREIDRLETLGVAGIVTNDPRLFEQAAALGQAA
jgi:glycerophosphoryl diester phosphodiesterase